MSSASSGGQLPALATRPASPHHLLLCHHRLAPAQHLPRGIPHQHPPARIPSPQVLALHPSPMAAAPAVAEGSTTLPAHRLALQAVQPAASSPMGLRSALASMLAGTQDPAQEAPTAGPGGPCQLPPTSGLATATTHGPPSPTRVLVAAEVLLHQTPAAALATTQPKATPPSPA